MKLFSRIRATSLFKRKFFWATFIALPLLVFATDATYPTWWLSYNLTGSQPPSSANMTLYGPWVQSNYEPANQGQLKNFATQAKAYLDVQLGNLTINNTSANISGSGAAINTLVSSFSTNATINYAPVNLGQLKAVVKPFYDRLQQIGYNTRSNLIANGLNATAWLYDYPWDPNAPYAQNYAPVNLGQLKLAFSFDLSANFTGNIATGSDTDHDGIPGFMEAFLGTHTGTNDTDGDGAFDNDDALPLDPAFNSVPTLFMGDTSFPDITLSDPSGAVLVAHAP